MMKTDKKKLGAAIAAVYAHLSTTGQAVYAQPETEPAQVTALLAQATALLSQATALLAQAQATPHNTWGTSGRQTQMQANSMMQMRAFK